MHRCAFCGIEFTQEQAISACGSCPLSNCKLVKCPNCGYEALPEAKSFTLLKNIFSKKKKNTSSKETKN